MQLGTKKLFFFCNGIQPTQLNASQNRERARSSSNSNVLLRKACSGDTNALLGFGLPRKGIPHSRRFLRKARQMWLHSENPSKTNSKRLAGYCFSRPIAWCRIQEPRTESWIMTLVACYRKDLEKGLEFCSAVSKLDLVFERLLTSSESLKHSLLSISKVNTRLASQF